MEKLKLSDDCFEHKNAEEQKAALLALVEASKVFGIEVLEAGLEKQNCGCGVSYRECFVGFCRNKGGSWMLFVRETDPNQRYSNVYKEGCTILLGWGFKVEVMTGEAPLSGWGWNGMYYIPNVPSSVISEFENSEISNYAELDGRIKKYQENLIWDDEILDDDDE